MKKFFARGRKRITQSRKRRSRFRSACLALGLATAWGGNAQGDVTLRVDITPQQTITNAVVLYGNNVSTGILRSLGTLPGGITSTVYHTMVGNGVSFEEDWSWAPESYQPGERNQAAVWAVIALYEGPTGPGVTVSFPNDDAIESTASWSSIFEREDQISDYRYSEAGIVGFLEQIDFFAQYPQVVKKPDAKRFLELYTADRRPYLNAEIATAYGQLATLVNFSDASFGGSVRARVVPEPAAWCLLVTAAGLIVSPRHRRRAC